MAAKGQRSPQRPLRWDRSRGLGQSPSPITWRMVLPAARCPPWPALASSPGALQASTARVSVGLGVCCPAAPAERKPPGRSGPTLSTWLTTSSTRWRTASLLPNRWNWRTADPQLRPVGPPAPPPPRPRYLCAVRDHKQLHIAGLSGHWPVLRGGDKKPVSHPATARLSSARLCTLSSSGPRSWPRSAGGALVGAGGGALAQTKELALQPAHSQAQAHPSHGGGRQCPRFAGHPGVWGCTGQADGEAAGRATPHPGPEGRRDPRPEDGLQAAVVDPAGAGLLLQVLRLVQRVLPLFPAPIQGLDQVDGGAGLEEAPEAERSPWL